MDSEQIEGAKRERDREFEKWHKLRHRFGPAHPSAKEQYARAWANVAYVADLERRAMGRELNKLQQRIGRQREANRRQGERIRELEAERARARLQVQLETANRALKVRGEQERKQLGSNVEQGRA